MDEEAKRAEIERFTAKRDNGRWSAVVGVGLMFASTLLVQLAIGGALMLAYGAVVSMYWSRRIRQLKGDPWAYDPELDGPRPPV